VSYAFIIVPFISLGTNSILIKYLPSFKEKSKQHELNGLALLINLFALAVLALVSFACIPFVDVSALDAGVQMLLQHVGFLGVLILSLTFFQLFVGYCTTQLKTTISLIFGDAFLKAAYLILGLLYLYEHIDFQLLLTLYVSSYVLASIVVFFQAFSLGFRAVWPGKLKEVAEIIRFGIFNILDKASTVLVVNLDIVMIGWLMLDLAPVAEYALPFFIGSVVIIPQRAIQIVSSPLTSKSLADNRLEDVKEILQKVGVNQLLFGGLIFRGIWTNIDGLLLLVPEKFQGGKWVVLYIGLSRLSMLLASTTTPIMVYSKYFKSHLYLTLVLVVLTVISNLILIPPIGIEGAALATFISLTMFTVLKLVFVQQKFNIHPFTKKLFISIALIAVLTTIGYYLPKDEGSILWIIAKSALVCGIYVLIALALRLSPDINTFWEKWKGKIMQ